MNRRARVAAIRSYLGYRTHRRNPYTGGYNVLLDGREQGIVSDQEGRWVCLCDEHATILACPTIAYGLQHLSGAEWCEPCMAIAYQDEPKNDAEAVFDESLYAELHLPKD